MFSVNPFGYDCKFGDDVDPLAILSLSFLCALAKYVCDDDLQGLLQNEYEGTSFASAVKHTPPVSGQSAVDMAYPFPLSSLGKWNILAVLAGMAGVYRILFCVSVAVCQKLRPRLHVE